MKSPLSRQGLKICETETAGREREGKGRSIEKDRGRGGERWEYIGDILISFACTTQTAVDVLRAMIADTNN